MNDIIKKIIEDNWEKIQKLIIEKVEIEAKKKEKTIWDLSIHDNEEYYCLSGSGNIDISRFSTYMDKNARDIGNAFLNRKDAEFEKERRKIETLIKKYSRSYRLSEENYSIYYDHRSDDVNVSTYHMFNEGLCYFQSKESAEKIINMIGKDKLKKYWFKVK